jgi:hypothetical protein
LQVRFRKHQPQPFRSAADIDVAKLAIVDETADVFGRDTQPCGGVGETVQVRGLAVRRCGGGEFI